MTDIAKQRKTTLALVGVEWTQYELAGSDETGAQVWHEVSNCDWHLNFLDGFADAMREIVQHDAECEAG